VLGLRRGEGKKAAVLALFVFFGHSIQAVGKVLQYSVFLSEHGRADIPTAFLMAALGLVLVSVGLAGLARHFAPRRVSAWVLAVVAGGFAFWRLFGAWLPWSGYLLYVWVEVSGLLAVVVSWNLVNNSCDPRQARRVMPLVGLGASTAFVVSGLVVHPLVVHGMRPEELSWLVVALALAAFVLLPTVGDGGSSRFRWTQAKTRPVWRAESGSRREGFWQRFFQDIFSGLASLWKVELLRLFAVATILMRLSQEFLDYAFMTELQRRFTSEGLASFLALFLALLGGAQILVQIFGSSRFLARFGVVAGSASAPAVVAIGTSVFVLSPSFALLAVLRFVERLLKTALYSPAVQGLYTPVPKVEKLQAMTLIKGVLSPVSYALGALVLMLFAVSWSVGWVVGVAGGASLATACWLGFRGKRAYVEALNQALDRRHLDLSGAQGDTFALIPDRTVLERFIHAVREGPDGRATFVLGLLTGLPADGITPVVEAALESPSATVRLEAIRLLRESGGARVLRLVENTLDDPDGRVVTETLALWSQVAAPAVVEARMQSALVDPRPMVRAASALWLLGTDDVSGLHRTSVVDVCNRLVRSSESGDRIDLAVAIRIMKARWSSDLVHLLLVDSDERVRAEALRCVGDMALRDRVPDLLTCLTETGPRLEAARAAAQLGSAAIALLRRVADGSDEVLLRLLPRIVLSVDSDDAVGLLVDLLGHPKYFVRLGAAQALARDDGRFRAGLSRAVVAKRLEETAVAGFRYLGLRAGVHPKSGEAPLFWAELDHLQRRVQEQSVALVGLLMDRETAARLQANVVSGDRRLVAASAELIDNICVSFFAVMAVPLIERGVDPGLLGRVPVLVRQAYEEAEARPGVALAAAPDFYLKAFALHELPGLMTGVTHASLVEATAMRPMIDRILFLKTVPIFSALSGEELHRIAEIATELAVPASRTIFSESDPGDAMYLVLSGKVAIRYRGRQVAMLQKGECFGEMALLDHQPRSADALAVGAVDLLRIEARDFEDLLAQKYEIVKGILRVLTGRLRVATSGRDGAEASETLDGRVK